MSASAGKRRTTVALATLVMVGAATFVSPRAGANHGAAIDCPDFIDSDQVQDGWVAQGFTVTHDDTRRPFTATVLDVLQDGVAPGRNMIVVQLSGPPIAEVGSAWAGMSGSPVYYQDDLIGVVGYQLSDGPSTVVGLTAAEDVFALKDYPSALPSETAQRVPLSASTESSIESATGESVASTAALVPLAQPVGISGLAPHRRARELARIERAMERDGSNVLAYAAAGTSDGTVNAAADATLHAGENFAATISYGVVTMATIGTTSIVCGDRAVALGHPLDWKGKTLLGANAADAVAIVDSAEEAPDPDAEGNDWEGPYKLAQVEEEVGIVDQDRLAGLRAILSQTLTPVPVVVVVHSDDLDITRRGTTFVTQDKYVGAIGFYTLVGLIDATVDQIGGGSSEVIFTVRGTREDGSDWQLRRANVYAHPDDIAFESAVEMQRHLLSLTTQQFEDVNVTRVHVEVRHLTEEVERFRVKALQVRTGGGYEERRAVRGEPGETLSFRTMLRASGVPATGETPEPCDATPTARCYVESQLTIPRRADDDMYVTTEPGGGRERYFSCVFDPDVCRVRLPRSIDSFEELLLSLASEGQNNDLATTLRRRRSAADQSIAHLSRVISGQDFMQINIGGDGGGGGVGPVPD